MKILDRYIAKKFLIGYAIAFMVLIGMCVVIDLFVNLDEFAELQDTAQAEVDSWWVLKNIVNYYGIQSMLYFRNFAGMITIIAAVFSLGKMTHNNELIAIMASGVSLKRVIAPIVFLAILLIAPLIIVQEVLIPRFANQLIRSHDSLPGEKSYDVWFMDDDKGSLICTKKFEEKTSSMLSPIIILRKHINAVEWETLGKIQAEKAFYNQEKKRWDLVNGTYVKINKNLQDIYMDQQQEKVDFYESSLTPEEIPMRQQEGYKSLLSTKQLIALERHGKRVKEIAELVFQKQSRITEPIINMVMLMVALPILVCRDPKAMKSSILISFAMTSLCFILSTACKVVATEVFFNRVVPQAWAWLPIAIFLPIAFIELDSMKT